MNHFKGRIDVISKADLIKSLALLFPELALFYTFDGLLAIKHTIMKTYSNHLWGGFSAGSSEKVDRVMDQVEKYIMTRLYKSVFCPETTDDEKKDLVTQHRIR